METSKLVLIFKDSLEQVHPRELGPIKNTKLQTAIFKDSVLLLVVFALIMMYS